jgi:uncharacterized membrane protein YccC
MTLRRRSADNRAVRAAMRPGPGRWGVVPGLRAVVAAGIVLGGAVALADLSVGGIAYLGVACAVSFVGAGGPRSRAARVAGQAAGAAIGMTVGALVPGSALWVVTAAVVVGFVAGALGRIGPASTGGAVMAVVGVAYTQFGRLAMPWWEPVLAYLLGSAVLLLLALAEAATSGRHDDRKAVAAVFDAAADLVATPDVDAARHRLAQVWAVAQEAVVGYRLRPATGGLADAWAAGRDAADHAARIADRPAGTSADARAEGGRRWRVAAVALRDRTPDGPARERLGPGPATRARSVLGAVAEPAALWTGARVSACVGVATAVAILLRTPAHAFWIPLTVAVVVRPEYGAVLVRSVHRLAGTLVGVIVVAVLLALTSSPAWIAGIAALSLGLAAFGAPRLYGLAVVGITGSALLSVALSSPDGLDPWARLLDTVLGCAIALVVGVVAWPRRGLPDQPRAFAQACLALAEYADLALRADGGGRADRPRTDRPELTDEAYRRAHAWRAQLERDLAQPDPTHTAADWLPVAYHLEHVVDAVSAAATRDRDPARHVDVAGLLRSRAYTPAEATAVLAAVTERLHSDPDP